MHNASQYIPIHPIHARRFANGRSLNFICKSRSFDYIPKRPLQRTRIWVHSLEACRSAGIQVMVPSLSQPLSATCSLPFFLCSSLRTCLTEGLWSREIRAFAKISFGLASVTLSDVGSLTRSEGKRWETNDYY
jgi:hypothetical protein